MTRPPSRSYSDTTTIGFPVPGDCQPNKPGAKPKSKLTEKKIWKMINMRQR